MLIPHDRLFAFLKHCMILRPPGSPAYYQFLLQNDGSIQRNNLLIFLSTSSLSNTTAVSWLAKNGTARCPTTRKEVRICSFRFANCCQPYQPATEVVSQPSVKLRAREKKKSFSSFEKARSTMVVSVDLLLNVVGCVFNIVDKKN